MAKIGIVMKNGKEVVVKADNLSREDFLEGIKEGINTGAKFTTYEGDDGVVGVIYGEISHFYIK